MTDFDFGDLEIVPSDEPLPRQIRASRQAGPNPFTEVLKASVEHSTPYRFYVPVEAVTRSVGLINQAAAKLGYGVRIVANIERAENGAPIKNAEGKVKYLVETRGPARGKVMIAFQGNTKRKTQKAPRIYSIVKDPENADKRLLRHRESGTIVAEGSHEEMRAALKARTA